MLAKDSNGSLLSADRISNLSTPAKSIKRSGFPIAMSSKAGILASRNLTQCVGLTSGTTEKNLNFSLLLTAVKEICAMKKSFKTLWLPKFRSSQQWTKCKKVVNSCLNLSKSFKTKSLKQLKKKSEHSNQICKLNNHLTTRWGFGVLGFWG